MKEWAYAGTQLVSKRVQTRPFFNLGRVLEGTNENTKYGSSGPFQAPRWVKEGAVMDPIVFRGEHKTVAESEKSIATIVYLHSPGDTNR